MSQFIELELPDGNQFTYRCWDQDGHCLYVGKHRGIHPAARLSEHAAAQSGSPWWGEVHHVDYAVVHGNLEEAEKQQIRELDPKYNIEYSPSNNSRRGRRTFCEHAECTGLHRGRKAECCPATWAQRLARGAAKKRERYAMDPEYREQIKAREREKTRRRMPVAA